MLSSAMRRSSWRPGMANAATAHIMPAPALGRCRTGDQLSRAAQCVRYRRLVRGPPGGPDLGAEAAAVGDVEAGAAGPGADFGDGGFGTGGGGEQDRVGGGRAGLGGRFGDGPL